MSERTHVQTLIGFDPYAIHVPLTKKELQIALQYNLTMQMALNDFQNVISFHLPKGKLWDFLQCTKFIITNIIASQPISNAPTYFIDGNKKGKQGLSALISKRNYPLPILQYKKLSYMLYMLFCHFNHYPSTYILIPNTLLPFFLILLQPFYTT